MGWTVTYEQEKAWVLLRSSGVFDPERDKGAIEQVFALSRRHDCLRCLTDHRGAELAFSYLDAYERPAYYAELPLPPGFRLALVFRQVTSTGRFYETVCRNRGLDVAVFSDLESAEKWLAGPVSEEPGGSVVDPSPAEGE